MSPALTEREVTDLTPFHRYLMDGIRRDAKSGKFVVVIGGAHREDEFTRYLRERDFDFVTRPQWFVHIGRGRVKFVWSAEHLRGMSPDVLVLLPEVTDERAFSFARAVGLGGRCEIIRG